MLKSTFFILCGIVALEIYGSPVNPQENSESICLLRDAPQQCGAFCLSALSPLYNQMANFKPTEKTELKVVLTKLEYAINTTNATTSKFELIGSRYFYIEQDISQNWTTAASTCRQMGGHLASFKDQEELDAIAMKLHLRHGYWLGVNDHTKRDTFVSLASGMPAFLMSEFLERYSSNDNPHCVGLIGGRNVFRLVPCWIKMNFICQADDKV
ncbi:hypothetical protein M5D96_004573 [Drosophila gunungcola]|uniref:C-type lectin domain-containing protein n=1 Tax=Drosophila gunungcola TaxID=103775 RepID=A0A9P9YUC4_9MUSC|nr:hypothetical protein M5D96_004573 [Drosophila gunungcola]